MEGNQCIWLDITHNPRQQYPIEIWKGEEMKMQKEGRAN